MAGTHEIAGDFRGKSRRLNLVRLDLAGTAVPFFLIYGRHSRDRVSSFDGGGIDGGDDAVDEAVGPPDKRAPMAHRIVRARLRAHAAGLAMRRTIAFFFRRDD